MDFELTEQQRLFQQEVRDFTQKEIAPLADAAEANAEFPAQLFPMMGDKSYLCLTYPPEYGGPGRSKIAEVIEWEEASRPSLAISGGLAVQSGVATSAIKNHGTEEQKQKYLVPAIKGRKITCFGLSEPNAGSDVAALETTAKREGSKYVLNGNKLYITNGTLCDFATVAAYTDKGKRHRGISLFVVDRDAPGFQISKFHKFCYKASDTAEFVFQDCVIPEENLIGEEGKGFYYLMESLETGRISHAAMRIGACTDLLEAALDYAKQKTQFGRPIASDQANAFALARMAMQIQAARWVVYHAAWLYDQKKPCTKEASMAKLLASEAHQSVAAAAMQVYGIDGVFPESRIHQHYTGAFIGTMTEGTSEIQQLVIARQLGIDNI